MASDGWLGLMRVDDDMLDSSRKVVVSGTWRSAHVVKCANMEITWKRHLLLTFASDSL